VGDGACAPAKQLIVPVPRRGDARFPVYHHFMPLVRYLSTRIAVMERGRLVETGEAVTLCANPREAYTRQLIAATPELPAGVA
jgi:ABC-type oligopeptide transport system ATPase subunit